MWFVLPQCFIIWTIKKLFIIFPKKWEYINLSPVSSGLIGGNNYFQCPTQDTAVAKALTCIAYVFAMETCSWLIFNFKDIIILIFFSVLLYRSHFVWVLLNTLFELWIFAHAFIEFALVNFLLSLQLAKIILIYDHILQRACKSCSLQFPAKMSLWHPNCWSC